MSCKHSRSRLWPSTRRLQAYGHYLSIRIFRHTTMATPIFLFSFMCGAHLPFFSACGAERKAAGVEVERANVGAIGAERALPSARRDAWVAIVEIDAQLERRTTEGAPALHFSRPSLLPPPLLLHRRGGRALPPLLLHRRGGRDPTSSSPPPARKSCPPSSSPPRRSPPHLHLLLHCPRPIAISVVNEASAGLGVVLGAVGFVFRIFGTTMLDDVCHHCRFAPGEPGGEANRTCTPRATMLLRHHEAPANAQGTRLWSVVATARTKEV